jgi:hypothetical protein
MPDTTLTELDAIHREKGKAAAIDHLIAGLRRDRKYHQLFDALLMKKRLEMGLSLVRPTSLKDVPEAQRDAFEKFYIDSAREVGELLLADNQIAAAWNYFRAINEPQKLAAAIEALPEGNVEEQVVEIALFHGVAPVKGVKLFLASHGTCSTITALDQQFGQMTPEVRKECARVMVQNLFTSLRDNVESDVQRRQVMIPPGQSLRQLIAGRDMLFAEDNYHIDVSHLNAVVRFARSLDATCPELDLALQLAQYGSRLAPQYQYAGNAPFDDFYPAHIQYFKALLGQNQDEALAYFRDRLKDDPADTENQLTAYVLADLLLRLEKTDEALDITRKYLADSAEDFGLSIPELCAATGRYDVLKQIAADRGDVINYAAALLQQ